jgi:hypothetical protein
MGLLVASSANLGFRHLNAIWCRVHNRIPKTSMLPHRLRTRYGMQAELVRVWHYPYLTIVISKVLCTPLQ